MNKGYRLVPMPYGFMKREMENSGEHAWACLIQNGEAIDYLNEMLKRDDITSAYFTTHTGEYDDIYIAFGYPSFAYPRRYFKVVWR